MRFDVFVLILDDKSRYVMGKLTYDSAIAAHTYPESTVVLISANQAIERIIVGSDAKTIQPPLSPLSNRQEKGRHNPIDHVMDWILEAVSSREADNRPVNAIGVLADFDPYKYAHLLKVLEGAKQLHVLNETGTRPKPKGPVVDLSAPKGRKQAGSGTTSQSATKKQTTTIPSSQAVTRTTASSGAAPRFTATSSGSATSGSAGASGSSTPPTQSTGTPGTGSKSQGMSPLKRVLTAFILLTVLAVPFGQPVMNFLNGSGSEASDPHVTPATSIPTATTSVESPEETRTIISPTETAPESEPTEIPSTEVPTSTVETVELPRLGPRLTEDEIAWDEGHYYDIGGQDEPELTNFSGAVSSSSRRIEGWSCDLGGSRDWTYRQTSRLRKSVVTIDVEPDRYVHLRFCVDDVPGETDWYLAFVDANPAIFECTARWYWTLEEPDVRQIAEVSILLDRSCVIEDRLDLEFGGRGDSYTGIPIWGVLVTQGDPVGAAGLIEPIEEATEPPQNGSSLTTGEIAGNDGHYYDIGGTDEPELTNFSGVVSSDSGQGDRRSCELGGYQDWTQRVPLTQQTDGEFATITVPVTRNVDANVTMCIEDTDPSVQWSIWLGNLPPAEHDCQLFHLSRPDNLEKGLNVISWTVPANCVHRDDLMLVFIDASDSGSGVWGLVVEQTP